MIDIIRTIDPNTGFGYGFKLLKIKILNINNNIEVTTIPIATSLIFGFGCT